MAGDQGSISSCNRHIGVPGNFQRCQASSPFEALNSAFLSSCQMYWRAPVEMRRNYWFSTDSTGDLHIPSSCEIIDDPAFKSLQGNPAYFDSGNLGVHSTRGSKMRVPLTSL